MTGVLQEEETHMEITTKTLGEDAKLRHLRRKQPCQHTDTGLFRNPRRLNKSPRRPSTGCHGRASSPQAQFVLSVSPSSVHPSSCPFLPKIGQ
jgi:hypothetical protein